MPASTIRYYEQQGLITPPRRVAGKREFDENTVSVLEFIQLSQAAGFSIAETKNLLNAYASNQSAGGVWLAMATTKQDDVRAQIQSLQNIDAILTELISCRCDSLADCVRIGKQRKRSGRGKRHASR